MTLLDGGSKETWAERLFSSSSRASERFYRRTYWTAYFIIPIFTAMHAYTSYEDHNGQGWKYILAGIAFMALTIWRRPKNTVRRDTL
jgi:hypothetical protein